MITTHKLQQPKIYRENYLPATHELKENGKLIGYVGKNKYGMWIANGLKDDPKNPKKSENLGYGRTLQDLRLTVELYLRVHNSDKKKSVS